MKRGSIEGSSKFAEECCSITSVLQSLDALLHLLRMPYLCRSRI